MRFSLFVPTPPHNPRGLPTFAFCLQLSSPHRLSLQPPAPNFNSALECALALENVRRQNIARYQPGGILDEV